jgi:hypothetical protein
MILGQTSLREPRRFGRVALTALMIGLGVAAISAVPFADHAFADKGGNGNGGGHGGGNGGGHGGGNGGGHGGGGNGNGGNGNGGGNTNGHSHDGAGNSAKAGATDDSDTDGSDTDDSDTASSDDTTTDDGSMKANKLGKLNGFFHASPNALANASPNSSIGKISKTFRDALSAFAEANAEPTDTDTETGTEGDAEATPPTGPTVEDLGAILAGATNKKVTATQVNAIIDRLAEQNPDDDALNHFADSVDDSTAQDIADAANAAKSGETVDGSDEDTAGTDTGTDTSSGDTTGDGGTDESASDTTEETPTVVTN